MANFIELHNEGRAQLVNLDFVEEIHCNGDGGCVIYFAFNLPNAVEQDILRPDESYERVKALLKWR